MSGRRYSACVSTCYSPEELKSMAVWDSFCEAEPLTLAEIKSCNKRDHTIIERPPGWKPKIRSSTWKPKNDEERKKQNERIRKWRENHREELLERQRAYDAEHREERNEKQKARYWAKKKVEQKNGRTQA